jgi:hypothetical protein
LKVEKAKNISAGGPLTEVYEVLYDECGDATESRCEAANIFERIVSVSKSQNLFGMIKEL